MEIGWCLEDPIGIETNQGMAIKRKTQHWIKGYTWIHVNPKVCACLCFLSTNTAV